MKNYVLVAVLVLFSTVIMQTILVIHISSSVEDSLQLEGKAISAMNLCVGIKPVITHDCPLYFNQSTRIEDNSVMCNLSISSYGDQPIDYWLNYLEGIGLEAFIDENLILHLDANNSAVGNRSINFSAVTTNDCVFSYNLTYDFEVLFINDPPEFILNLESINLREGSAVFPWFLDNHFTDPDDPVLSYQVFGANNFLVTINPDTSQVRIVNPSGNCDDDEIYFVATDSGNLTADSNMVTLEAICDDPPVSTPSSPGGIPREFCEPEWNCGSWSRCLENGTRYRDCNDINVCDPNNYQRRFWEECEYIPPVEPEEEVEEDEEEIQIETPAPIVEDPGTSYFTLILATILAVSIVSIGYLTFRKEIKVIQAKLYWLLTKYKRKQILLTNDQKISLLKKINNSASNMELASDIIKSTHPLVHSLTAINREYFSYVFKLPAEFTKQEIDDKIPKLKRKPLENAFIKLYRKMHLLETRKTNLLKIYAMAYLQELRHLVINTSEVNAKDFNYRVHNYPLKGKSVQILLKNLNNAYNALQFNQLNNAKKYYYNCLEQYELLDTEKKKGLIHEITKLYDYLTYMVSWNTKK